MDTGCECAPWVRSANPSDSWAVVKLPVVIMVCLCCLLCCMSSKWRALIIWRTRKVTRCVSGWRCSRRGGRRSTGSRTFCAPLSTLRDTTCTRRRFDRWLNVRKLCDDNCMTVQGRDTSVWSTCFQSPPKMSGDVRELPGGKFCSENCCLLTYCLGSTSVGGCLIVWRFDSPKVTYPSRISNRWKLTLINSLSCPEQTLSGHAVDCYCYCLANMDDSTGCLWSGYGTMGTDYSSGCSQARFSHYSPVPLTLECWSWGVDAWVSGRTTGPSDYRTFGLSIQNPSV